MNLEENETRNDCAGEDQKFTRQSDQYFLKV
jgi:hypothetical protein